MKEGEELLVCDCCMRSEVAPIVAGESKELLVIKWDNANAIHVCADCEKEEARR